MAITTALGIICLHLGKFPGKGISVQLVPVSIASRARENAGVMHSRCKDECPNYKDDYILEPATQRERACSLQVLLTGKTSVDHTPQLDMTSHTEGGLVLLQIRGKGVVVF